VESLVKNAEEQMNARRFSEAVETLQMAARLDPGDVAVRENLETARQRAEAARAADRLVSEARLAVDRGDLSRAAELAKQVLQTGIDSPETRATLQAIEARVGELQKARAIDDTILAARKLYTEMRFEEGIALLDDSLRRYPGEERLESAQKDLQARVQEMGQRGSPPQAPLPPSPPPPAPEEFSGATAIQPRSLRKAEPADERKPLAEAAEGRTQIFSTPSGAQMLPEVYLVFRSTVDRLLDGKPVRITKVPFEIGRAAGDLAIASDKGLSRVHAVIDWNNGAFTITDSGSSNGTYLEGRRLASGVPVPLIFWAKIHLTSATVLTFRPGALDELPDLTGELIADRYELRKAIRTGLKSVYEAHDRRLLQSVMVKLLCPGLARYPGYLEQFRREAQTAAGLKHAHICAIIDYGETSVRVPGSGMATVPYISGDFLGGGNLEDRVKLPDEIGPEKTLRWLSNISSALSCAHRKKVVHGNLKPSSIVFDAEGNASLTDFAIGNIAFDKGQKTYLATPEYMAPEEWEGAEASEATDQFALAVLAYLTLTGRRPFESSIKPEAARESFQRGPAPAHEVGAAVTAVLQKALSVDPSQRYESIKVFFEALQSAITVPAPTDFKPRVFLSYRRDESAMAARVLAMELEKRHEISVFVDTERVDSAVPFPQELARAIDRCDIFMCLLGRKTLNSSWVNEEIRLAHTLHKDMIPVFQERFAMPKSAQSLPEPAAVLLRHQAVHLLDLKGIYVDAAVDKVAKMIVESMKRKAKGKP
jgi:tetratricopeptide (TPR) repeat protein